MQEWTWSVWGSASFFNVAWFILIGLVAGWLAGLLMRGKGFGCLGNILVGIIGALIGGMLFQLAGLHFGGSIGALFTALVGAIILLFVAGVLRKASS